MELEQVNVGAAPNDDTGDLGRDAFIKINGNFEQLYGEAWRFQTATFGVDTTAWQPWFPSAPTSITLEPGTYEYRGIIQAQATNSVSHNTRVGLGGTATLSDIHSSVVCGKNNTAITPGAANIVSVTTALPGVAQTATNTDRYSYFNASGVFRVTAAGTVIPQIQFSASGLGTVIFISSIAVRLLGGVAQSDNGWS
jgi:hypothetical protein